MSTESGNAKEQYASFDPKGYRERINDREGGKFREEELFWFESMKKIFDNPSLRGVTLLDIGSGPTVHNLIPACIYYPHIVLSDFAESNLNELKKWLNGDTDALDWSRLLTLAIEAQGHGDIEKRLKEAQDIIRKNVKAVVYCDVLSERIVPPEYDSPYDLVMTSLTLEAAAPDYETFKQCLKKLNRLLKIGGHLVMKGFLEGSPWRSGEKEYPFLSLTKHEIHSGLIDAGFDEIMWYTMMKKDFQYEYDFQSCYCLSCRKSEEI